MLLWAGFSLPRKISGKFLFQKGKSGPVSAPLDASLDIGYIGAVLFSGFPNCSRGGSVGYQRQKPDFRTGKGIGFFHRKAGCPLFVWWFIQTV
jgi:hypothetical protein